MKKSITTIFALAAIFIASASLSPAHSVQASATASSDPDCSKGWPSSMAFIQLRNAGTLDKSTIDSSKTKTVRHSSEKIGDDLFHQVYDVHLVQRSGGTIEAIAVHNVSVQDECSMTGVDLYVVSQHPQAR